MPPTTNLQLHLDADDASTITQSGGFVTSWADKSGNGYNFIQPNTANSPITVANELNGRTVIRFDGVSDRLSTGSSGLVRNWAGSTIYFVARARSVSGRRDMFAIANNNTSSVRTGLYLPLASTGFSVANRIADSDSLRQTNSPLNPQTYWRTYVAESNHTANRTRAYLNNTLVQTTTGTTTAGNSSNTAAAITIIGCGLGINMFSDIDVAEILVYEGAHNDTQRAEVLEYIKTKWGIDYTLEEETTLAVDRMSPSPNAKRVKKINDFVKGLKTDLSINVLKDNFDLLYLFSGDDRQHTRLNLVDTNGEITQQGSPIWDKRKGYSAPTSSDYLDTNWQPNSGINFLQNTASYGYYAQPTPIDPPMGENSQMAIGSGFTNLRFSHRNRNSGGILQANFRINSTTSLTGNNVYSNKGLYTARRTTNTATQFVVDDTVVVSSGTTSNARVSDNMYILRTNDVQNYVLPSLILSSAFTATSLSDSALGNLKKWIEFYLKESNKISILRRRLLTQ